MIDWGLIISGVIGLITGGGASWLLKLREDKASAKADALTKMNEVIAYQVTSFGDTLKKQDIIISDQRELTNN